MTDADVLWMMITLLGGLLLLILWDNWRMAILDDGPVCKESLTTDQREG